VGGANGKVMVCPECQGLPAGQRPLFTQLNRETALRLTCAKLVGLLRADQRLVDEVVAAFRRHVAEAQEPDPAALQSMSARVEKLSQRIGFVMSNPGETDADRAESGMVLRSLRAERSRAEADKAALEAARRRPAVLP